MDLSTLDLLLRGAIVALSSISALLLLISRRPDGAAGAGAWVIGGIGAYALSSLPEAPRILGFAAFVFDAWCLSVPAMVLILACHLFQDGFRRRWPLLLWLGALTGVGLAADWGRFGFGLLAERRETATLLLIACRLAAGISLAAACWIAMHEWRADLVEQRRRARMIFIGTLTIVFGALAASDFVFGFAGAGLAQLVIAHALLLAVTVGIVLFVSRSAPQSLSPGPAPPDGGVPLQAVSAGTVAASIASAPLPKRAYWIEAGLAQRVTAAMEAKNLWRQEDLTIGALARQLGAPERSLRRAIHLHLGYRNFNDFLHDYRLNAAAEKLRNPDARALPILSIALDVGFGSIGPFNRAFKARYGLTPTQYRNVQQVDPSAPSARQQTRRQSDS